MVIGAHGIDSGTAVRRINDSLQGPVLEILSRYVPELGKLPSGKAYERTLGDIGLLQRCFEAFRAQREQFNHILVDADRQPVGDDRALLSCGRTLNQVVAMIVRSAAKRYFRRAFPHHEHRQGTTACAPVGQGNRLAKRVTTLFQDEAKRAHAPGADAARSRADELYDAIKDYLLHEWQVPLVPTYADMSPNLVRALGPKLLDLRSPDELRKVADDPAEAARLFDLPDEPGAEIKAASAGRRDERARLADILSPDGKRLRPEAFADALLRPDVRAQLQTPPQGLRLTETLRHVGAMPAKLLVAELGLRIDQLAVVLLVSHEMVGADVFGRIFGQPGEVELIIRITQKARLIGLSQKSTLSQCADFARQLFARFGQTRN